MKAEAPPVIAIVGATATGKSAVALALAEVIGGEIVNADSMQFYRGMDIGTAKVPASERRGIPHHQIDTLEVTEDATVARFQADARADLEAIHGRGRRAIAVGGSGLYLRALLDRFEFPETDPEVRARLESRAEREGPEVLHAELAFRDPRAAERILPGNAKRVVRALEVIELTGRPYSSTLPRREYAIPAMQVGLRLPYGELDPRIDARAEAMWDAGLLEETRGLVARGLREGTTARRAVGYAQALDVLDGRIAEETARAGTARATRRLARRQHQWFGPDPRIAWIEGVSRPSDVLRAVADLREAIATLES